MVTSPIPQPFKMAVPNETVSSILTNVAGYPWQKIAPLEGWSAGTNVVFLRQLAEYWTSEFDWRRVEARLNEFPQYLVQIGDRQIHFIHLRGSARRPLLLLHGWPGSILEFLDAAERLAWPERFGGDPRDGFDVVIPSLPGFGLSQAMATPAGPRQIAGTVRALMSDVLGYRQFIAQGGDWGSAIAAWLAHDHPEHCRAIHLNMALALRGDLAFETPSEREYAERRGRISAQEGAYALLQGTKPQTLAFAMVDNPIGVAAWITEKFASWTDSPRRDGDPDLMRGLGLDALLGDIMFYLVTNSFQTATWIYKGRMVEKSVNLPDGTFIGVPTGVAAFPDPVFRFPPRSLVEQCYNVICWTDMPKGGHFAALEVPIDFSSELVAFARLLD